MKVGIIGAGTMGSGIAQAFALKKVYDSIAADCSDSKIRELGEALNEVETTMNKSSVEVTNLITKLQLIKGHLYDIKDVRLDE